MGHDVCFVKRRKVTPYKDKFKRTINTKEEEVGHLRYSAGNCAARAIYKALKAEEHDGGCSGMGGEIQISERTLNNALAYYNGFGVNNFTKEKEELLKVLNDITKPSPKGFVDFICGIKRADWKYYVVFC